MVRQIFTAPTTVAKSVLYISAVGWTTAQINGVGVAPTEILNPGRTSFDVRQYYMAYDVTDMIKPGEKNCLGLLSAAGWQSMPHHTLSAKALLSITTTTTSAKSYVATAANWTGSVDGAITSANIYAGETYDANKEVHLPPPFSAPFCPPPPCSRPNILRPPLCSAHSSHVNHFSLP
jgi:alpha-L-rhamnosidase